MTPVRRLLVTTVAALAIAPLVAGRSGAQSGAIRAKTADGRVVLLYPNGTWKYDAPAPTLQAAASTAGLKVPASATEHLDLPGGYRISFDPNKWRRQKSTETNVHEFHHIGGDGYAKVILERLEIPLPSLKRIAIDNAREAAEDARVTLDEMRRVNGSDVLCMKLEGTMSGIAFSFYGYYFSSPRGAIQVITYTGRNLFGEYEADFADFLNGLQPGAP